MQEKMLDHLYHRTRVDAQITGNICLVAIMAILALTCGDKFEPFRFGANWLEPVRLAWVEGTPDPINQNVFIKGSWVLEKTLVRAGNFPPTTNKGPLDVREIQPISLSLVLTIGVFTIAYFIYASARRQTRLMNAVYANEGAPPYQRSWESIRITFWALDITLAFIMFFMLI